MKESARHSAGYRRKKRDKETANIGETVFEFSCFMKSLLDIMGL